MNRQIACAVVGATGRMGARLCHLITDAEGLSLAGVTEGPGSPMIGRNMRDALGLPRKDLMIVEGLEKIGNDFEVIIDFTFPRVSLETARFAARTGKRAVIGTTGFSDSEMAEIRGLCQNFPCVWAPNMSLGVNTLFKLVRDVAVILQEGFDVEIMEIHHRFKKDAPSGTALKIAEILAEAYGRDLDKVGVYARKGVTGQRPSDAIGLQTLRAGDVVGEHTVLFGGAGERLELIHRAQSRDCFAQGALHAAKWIVGRPNGLYDMQDVLGLRACEKTT